MLKLVYGCLAFSLVACVILFVAAGKKGQGFHGMTNAMGQSIDGGATILDADASGAITQTGNGNVVAYRRNGEKAWSTKVDRFKESPSNPYGAGVNNATAWCVTSCPTALVAFDNKYSAFDGVSAALVTELNALSPKPEDVMALSGRDTAFLRFFPPGNAKPQIYVSTPGKPRTLLVGVSNPSEVQPDQPRGRAVIGSVSGRDGVLAEAAYLQGAWQVTNRSIKEIGLKNVCVSDDEEWIGAVFNRVSRSAFGGRAGAALGPTITSGTCSVDDSGLTAVYTPKSNPNIVEAARYSAGGRTVWRHELGAQRLLSHAGSPLVVTQAANGTVTAIDATTGRTTYTEVIADEPFVGEDGSIVTANRKGEPKWLLGGKPAKN